MRKKNTKKEFPEKEGENQFATTTKIYDNVDEAIAVAKAQAEAAGVMPTAVMVSTVDGYVTGDGQVHGATGVTGDRQQAAPKADAEDADEEEAPKAKTSRAKKAKDEEPAEEDSGSEE